MDRIEPSGTREGSPFVPLCLNQETPGEMNNIKVFGSMALLTSPVMATGGPVGGQSGIILAFALAGAMNFNTYPFSSSMVRMAALETIVGKSASGIA